MSSVTHLLGEALMSGADAVEQALRQSFGLPAQAPDPLGYETVPHDDGLVSLVRLPAAEREAEFRAWHEEGWRARLCDEAGRCVYRLGHSLQTGYPLRALADAAEQALAERELAQARRLRFCGYHRVTSGSSTTVEGYWQLSSGRRLALEISCVGAESAMARDTWAMGGVASVGEHGYEKVILPTEALTPACVEVALRSWYTERFYFQRGHWAIIERQLPKIVVEPTMFTEGGPWSAEEQQRLDQAARQAERELVTYLNDEDVVERFAAFGAHPLPDCLRAA